MAEVLRDLVVSLSLKSDNFARNITSINKQIKEAESAFKLAGAGIDNYSRTTEGMSTKLSTLKTTLGYQKEAVSQYERALDAANKKLQESYDRQAEYSSRLEESKKKHEDLGEAIKNQEDALKTIADLCGKDCDAYRAEADVLDELKEKYKASGDEVKKLEQQLTVLQKSTQNSANAVSTAQTNLNNAKAAVAATKAEIEKLTQALQIAQSKWTTAGTALTDFSNKMGAVGKAASDIGKKLTVMVTTPLVALGKNVLQSSMDFESSFTSVRKTVDATEEEFARLANESKKMSTQIAASTTEINEVMATGGQLGIANEHLTDFTRVMIDLGNSCEDLDASTAADQLAKFANVMGTDQSLFKNIGSTVVELGNNFATTEQPIVEMAQRLAGAGKQVGLTEAQVLGVSAALSSVGIKAQMGGSAMSKALIKMEVAAETGGQALKDFAMVSNMTEQEFVQAWRNDPMIAFQAFIDGLAQIDDEGASAIATLNEIGISEIRLRDTLMRATNAHEMFSRAQRMATAAWSENTALTTEANKRYATLASRLTNLKNKAVLFGQTLGNDMRPAVQKAMDGVSKFIDKLSAMDSEQRKTILRIAAVAAAAGPVLLIFGKLATGVSKITGALGTFATAVGKAGGGVKGLTTVISSSPAVWLALAAAVAYGVYKLADWASGAKAAREAQEKLNETVEKWNENITTAYEKSKGLSQFGLTAEDFAVGHGAGDSGDWLTKTIETWTDGKKETNKIVSDTVKEFTDGTDKIREALNNLQDTAGGGTIGDLSGDLQTLDAIDKQVESILKRKQNGLLSEEDTKSLQELLEQRDAIRIKYKLVADTESSFDQIVQGVEAALSRGADGAATYSDAFAAATQGMGAFTDSLNAEYDARYKVISAMEDGAEKERELAQLRTWYDDQATAAQQQYLAALEKTARETGVFAEGGQFAETANQLETIYDLMDKAAGKDDLSAEMTALKTALAGLDETSIVEMESAITAMEAAAAGAGTTVPDEVAKAREALDAVKQAATDTSNVFSDDVATSLSTMFAGLGDETHEVYATLNCDNLSSAYDAWAAGEHASIIPGLDESQLSEINLTGNISNLVKAEDAELTIDADGNITGVKWPEGSVFTTDVKGNVTGVTTPAGTTYEVDAKGNIKSAKTADGVTLTVDAKGNITEAKTAEGVTFKVNGSGNVTIVNPADGVTFEVNGKGRITNAKPDDKVTFSVNGDGTVTSVVVRDGVTYTVNGKGEVTSVKTADGVTYTVNGKGTVTSVTTAEGVTYTVAGNGIVNAVSLDPSVTLPKVELEATATVTKVNPLELKATETKINDKIGGEGSFWDSINLFESTADSINKINDLTAAIEEYKQAAEEAREAGDVGLAAEFDKQAALTATTLATEIQNLSDVDLTNIGERMSVLMAALESGEGTPDQISAWTTELEGLKAAFEAIDPGAYNQTGTNVVEGIAQGMKDYAFDGDASTVAASILSACNSALGAHSPATTMIPTGSDVAEGIAEGMRTFDFAAVAGEIAAKVKASIDALMMPAQFEHIGAGAASGVAAGMNSYTFTTVGAGFAARVKAAVAANLNAGTLSSVGSNAMAGLAAGINSGTNSVVTAMRNAALAAVRAAKEALRIQSPSKVFRDEVGVMMVRGMGEGIEKEAVHQAKVLQNAARYLTTAAQGSIVAGSTDSRRTYNNESVVNLNVAEMNVRDKQDIHALASELAGLTRTKQRGRGLRMA